MGNARGKRDANWLLLGTWKSGARLRRGGGCFRAQIRLILLRQMMRGSKLWIFGGAAVVSGEKRTVENSLTFVWCWSYNDWIGCGGRSVSAVLKGSPIVFGGILWLKHKKPDSVASLYVRSISICP